jgi:hypothetical protein
MTTYEEQALAVLDSRLRTLLPEDYQDSYEDLEPVPMRSAGLQYRADGKVAWDRIWGSFCDLAMAGGPPHKGRLLEPGARADIEAQPDRYEEVAEEICRGVRMTADLDAEPSPIPGWVRVDCLREAMSGWLVRAVAMENVSVHREGRMLDVPAAPHFRLDKEIKNVVTVIAKTCHYWLGHMPRSQHTAIADLFAEMANESPLIAPALADAADTNEDLQVAASTLADTIEQTTGLHRSPHRYAVWVGIECPSIRAAIWMMRAMVARNVLVRREETALFLPVNPITDPGGQWVVRALTSVHGLAQTKGVLG